MSEDDFITTHYYRCYELDDPDLFFFVISTKFNPISHKARVIDVAILNFANGNIETTEEEDWSHYIALTLTDQVEELDKDVFIEVRKELIR